MRSSGLDHGDPPPGDTFGGPRTDPATPRSIRLAITIATLAVVAYAGFALFAGTDEILRALSRLSVADWTILLAFSLVHFALRFARWQRYLQVIGHRVPLGPSAAYYMSGFAMTMTPGKVGEAWRAVYLRLHGVPYADTVACFFAERYTDLMAILMLSVLALGIYEGRLLPFGFAAGLILVALLTIRLPWLPALLDRCSTGRRPDLLIHVFGGLARTLRISARLLSTALVGQATALAVVAWGVQGLVLHATLSMLGEPIGMAVAIGIYALAMLAGALSFLPGGLGSAEAVMILMLTTAGMGLSDATAATLICRLATLWFAVALGLSAVFGLWMSRARSPRS